MSVRVSNAVWQHSQSSGRQRLVLLAIADHQGEMGSWPAIPTIAKMVNASERSVQRDIKTLEEMGELIIQPQSAPTNGQYKANLYWVNLQMETDPKSGVTNPKSGVTESTSGVTESLSGVTKTASGVTAGGVLTLNRTLKEPINKKEHLLPEDFEPSKTSWDIMREHFPWIDLKLETHAFRDYWNSAPPSRAKKTDWDATWRNWIRNNAKRSQPADQPRKKHKF